MGHDDFVWDRDYVGSQTPKELWKARENKNVYAHKNILHVSNFDSILVWRIDTFDISLRYNLSN